MFGVLREKLRKGTVAVLALSMVVLVGGLNTSATEVVDVNSVSVNAAEDGAEGSTDVSGIAYIYPEESTSPSAINLNGNSVIIQASDNDTGSGNRWINIIIDKDKDGVIDEGEPMAAVDGSTDWIGGPSIYGYYNHEEATEPVTITVVSGYVPVVYGAYKSTLTTSGETAITMRMLGGEIPGEFCGAYESTVASTGATAVEVYVDSETTSYTTSLVCAATSSEITVKDSEEPALFMQQKQGYTTNFVGAQSASLKMTGSTGAAVVMDIQSGERTTAYGARGGNLVSDGTNDTMIDIDVRGKAAAVYGVHTTVIDAGKNTNKAVDIDVTENGALPGTSYGIMGTNTSGVPLAVRGCVDVNFKPESRVENNLYYMYAVYNYVTLDGDVTVNIENAAGNGGYAAAGQVRVSGDVTLTMPQGSEYTGSWYGMQNSMCEGNLTVRGYGNTENTTAGNSLYGFYGVYNGEPTVIGGDFTFEYLGGRCGYLYAGYGSSSSSTSYKIGGKADIKIRQGDIGSLYVLQNVSVGKDITALVGDWETDITQAEPSACKVGSTYTAIYNCGAENITFKSRITNGASDNKPYFYGVHSCGVSGNVTVVLEGGHYYYAYGTQNCSVQGTMDVTFKNLNEDLESLSSGGSSYGVYGGIAANTRVTIKDSKFTSLYATNGDQCAGNIVSEITNCDAYNWLAGPYTKSCGGDITSTITDSTCSGSVYGVYIYGAVEGGIHSTLTNVTTSGSNSFYGLYASSSYAIQKDVNVTMNNCTTVNSYGVNGAAILGNLVVDINGGTYGNASSSGYNYWASPTYVQGTSTITVSDLTGYGSFYPYSMSSGGCGDATITVENSQFHAGSNPEWEQIANTAGVDQKVTMTMDEDCSVADTLKIYASGNQGEGVITYNGETYYGGALKFTEDTEYKAFHFSGGSLYIPEGITVKIDAFYWDAGNILLEGTLDETIVGKELSEAGVYTGTMVYAAGGTMNCALGTIENVYYPFEINYKTKGGGVSTYSNYSNKPITHPQGGNRLFGLAGNEIKYNISAAEGFTLASVTYTADGVTNNVAGSGTLYTFTMPSAAVSFDIDFRGNQIVAGKTVTDPVLKLNVETTEENPAYDFSTLAISNDGTVGTITYQVDSVYGLPEGLSLEGDKIIGTPTVAYESGKKAIIHVTGKNDTEVEVSLNIVVTEGEGTQTSQEGRITVDETNLMIYMSENSVVIETQDNQTAIYLDDNRDGVADYDTPAVVGDFTNYTLYGLRNTDTTRPIRITMNGGTIGTIYGAYGGDITATGKSLKIDINKGSVGKLVMLENAKVSDVLEAAIGTEATVSTRTAPSATTMYKGFYWDQQGIVNVYGTYDFTDDINVKSLYLRGTHTIPEGVTVATEILYCYTGSVTKLKGTLTANTRYTSNSSYYGKLLMMGGTIPGGEENTWGYVFYPSETSTNVKNTSVTYKNSNDYYNVTENGVTTKYLRAGSIQVSVTAPAGYDYYYSVNDKDMVQITTPTSFYFNTDHKSTTFEVIYVPKQISVEKQFADPTGVVGTEYTAQEPLYDLRGLTITDDTVASYGGEVKYALKSTSTLPAGLTFADGRVIGTPTKVNLTGTTVSFVVTGRNGTTETVDVTLRVAESGYETPDINELVAVSGSYIYLKGTSVVMLSYPGSSTSSQIFLDLDHDGIADDNNPLLINDNASYNLGSYTIYGYDDTQKAYEGDISITLKGGRLASVYGVRGTSTSARAVVNGDITVNAEMVTMSGASTNVYGAYYGDTGDVTLSVTGGSYTYTEFGGAYDSKINGNLNFTMADELTVSTSSSGSSYHIHMYPSHISTVTGNVNMKLAPKSSSYGFISSAYRYSTFHGVYNSEVGGNVNCKVDGYWYTGNIYLVKASDVTGNVDVDIANGATLNTYNNYVYVAYDGTTIEGDVLFDVEENATFNVSGPHILHGSTANNVTAKIPESCKSTMNSITALSDVAASVKNGIYIDNKGIVSIGGTYTISEDMEVRGLTLLAGADASIAEGVTVKTTYAKLIIPSGAALTNNGTLDAYMNISGYGTGIGGTLINRGVLNTSGLGNSYYFPILATGCVINEEDAQWNVKGTVYNLGKIVNYGTLHQTYASSYYYYLGTVYTTQPLTLSWAPESNTSYRPTYSAPYAAFYYPVTLEYPSHCVDSVTLSGDAVSTSGVEGDMNQYVKAIGNSYTTPTFTVTLGETLLSTVKLTNVTYGAANVAAVENTDGTWSGYASGIFEPFTIKVNYEAADETTTAISLDKTSDRIENTEDSQPLVYNKYYSYSSPLYDLTNLTITNDMEGDGEVSYFVDSSSTLPNGMYLKDGRLYGTLKSATEEEQAITFIVKGKNQTTAFFTLTLGPVAKQVPNWSIPTGLSALAGETLADVNLPYNAQGTYSWPDTTVSVGEEITTLKEQTLWFTPKDTANYDWAAAAEKAGAAYADGVITCKVDVQVCAGVPTYTVPDTITATYGDTYGEVPIPAGDNDGKFVWYYASTSSVGSVGTYTRWVNYIPNDSNYQTVNYIGVTLVVEKAVPTYQKINSVSQECGSTLADIVLPDAEGGKYQWITTATTIPLDGKTYQVGFKPNDTTNYDWTRIEGWNDAWKCVVFPITVYLEHTYSTELTYNDTHHWYPCLDETCDSVENKEAHLWDEGFVLEEATMEKEGMIEYSCECGASYEDVIPKLTHPSHVYTGAWKYDADCHWKQCTYTDCVETTEPADHDFDEGVPVSKPTASKKGVVKYTCSVCKYVETEYLNEEEWENSGWGDDEEEPMEVGDEFEDPDTKAEYEIASGNNEVIYLAPDKKTYSKITIPNMVEFDGVHYKVTEIAPNAFKGNKKLKSVKIGSNIRTIGARAFYGCTKLAKVTMGANVTTIGNSAFQNCTALKNFTIPKNVSKIGSKAFYGCKKLTKMTIKTTKLTEKKVGKQAFTKMGSSNYKKVTVKVPKKKLKTYKKMLVKRGLSKKAKVKK